MATRPDGGAKLHVAMFPWFAFGHFFPYLQLSNEFAMRGHRVSFLLPRGAEPKLRPHNLHPSLIHFHLITVPPADNLPRGVETATDIPHHAQIHLGVAFDKTRDQVEAILTSLRPDAVMFDLACWLPPINSRLGIKSIYYAVVCAAAQAILFAPARMILKGSTPEELRRAAPPPGCPPLNLPLEEARQAALVWDESGIGITFFDRYRTCMRECDALSIKTCRELEGSYCDYLSELFSKPVFLSGPLLPEIEVGALEARWVEWLGRFEPGTVVYCALGSQIRLKKSQLQELVLGFEMAGLPFLAALQPPEGSSTVEEALPEGFEGRVEGRGVVEGGWVQQRLILNHPAIGCFVTHCGFGSMWEGLVSDCQMVTVTFLADQIINAALLAQEFKVAVEVERDEETWEWTKEGVCRAIRLAMDEESEVGRSMKNNHSKLKKVLSSQGFLRGYVDGFVENLKNLVK